MKLMTKKTLADLPPLYANESKGMEALAMVKFFTPDSNWTWYASEYNPAEGLFFGLVDGMEKEMGYFSLAELESARGPMGLPIERDLYFTPTKLSDLNGGS